MRSWRRRRHIISTGLILKITARRGRGKIRSYHILISKKQVSDILLISTGGSSLKAVEALRQAGSEVLGMVAVYTHGFPQAVEAFAEASVRLVTLSDYDTVITAKIGRASCRERV